MVVDSDSLHVLSFKAYALQWVCGVWGRGLSPRPQTPPPQTVKLPRTLSKSERSLHWLIQIYMSRHKPLELSISIRIRIFSVRMRLRISCVMTDCSSSISYPGQLLVRPHHRVAAALAFMRR